MGIEAGILQNSRTVAMVGLSSNPDRPSYLVANYLKEHGYRVIPVNPKEKEVLGEKAHPDLTSIPEPVDVVDIFRAADAVPGIVREAIKIKARVVWMQEGIISEEGAALARRAGLKVVMDRCIRKEHIKLHGA